MIRGLNATEIFVIGKAICKPCLEEWNKLLDGKIEQFIPCEDCSKIFKSISSVYSAPKASKFIVDDLLDA